MTTRNCVGKEDHVLINQTGGRDVLLVGTTDVFAISDFSFTASSLECTTNNW